MKQLTVLTVASAVAFAAAMSSSALFAAPIPPAPASMANLGGGGFGSCPYGYHVVQWGTDEGLMAGCAPGGGPAEFLSGNTPPPGTIYIHPVDLQLP